MKHTVTVTDFNGKSISKTFNDRNEEMAKICMRYKHTVEKPKKGKGSFKRNKKVDY